MPDLEMTHFPSSAHVMPRGSDRRVNHFDTWYYSLADRWMAAWGPLRRDNAALIFTINGFGMRGACVTALLRRPLASAWLVDRRVRVTVPGSSTMSRTAADFPAVTLAQAGVERIYGVVGDSLNGFTYALRRLKAIAWIHMRHEEATAFAAGAEPHLTGKLAVCAGSCGPGNLHLINGLFHCHRRGAAVLAIAAHIPSSEIS
jgi:hypothetical protein